VKIEQFIISGAITFFRERTESAYQIPCVNEKGYDPEAPCLFLGNYFPLDTDRINAHKGLTFVRWEGRDARFTERITTCKKNVVHLTDAYWLTDCLEKEGITSLEVPMFLGDMERYKPCPLGDKVYVYTSNPTFDHEFFEKVKAKIPFECIVMDNPFKYNEEELMEFYKQSFINLNFNRFDGLSTTVCEMGLMGRSSAYSQNHFEGNTLVTRSDLAWCFPWNDVNQVVFQINSRSRLRGKDWSLTMIADFAREYLQQGFDWMRREDIEVLFEG
jgi:hypothetical protein